MPTQVNYRNELKEHFGIHKNISNALTDQECEALWHRLECESEILKLVQSFNKKNSELRSNNSKYGRQRSQAEYKANHLEQEYLHLSQKCEALEKEVKSAQERKGTLTNEQEKIHTEISQLQESNKSLEQELYQLQSRNKELHKANNVLQKDNKDLKNTVDKIRLEVTRKIKELMRHDDKELRKGMLRMFKGMLG